ncbi:outer membrane beta-barrel protein [Hydrocarboniphaga sp.]|uniref:outer membrane beta-barrel protein n=1 Tax=Hydrocarboniphaga sp. TaxID=2033016 RepID=UPI00263786FF|nr:outer membrane beta-barrel protein [Hydrocarboniphaga sp.]
MPSAATWAELKLVPYGSAQYEFHSNLLEVSGPSEAEAERGDRKESDSVYQAKAGIEATVTAGQQQVEVDGEYRRLEYAHFDDLNHDEYKFGGRFAWKLGAHTDGNIDYRQEHRIASFADLGTSKLTEQTDRRASALLGYDVTPSWRVEAGAGRTESELPLSDDPEFKLKDTSGSVEVKYTGLAGFSVGVLTEYHDGQYDGNLEHRLDYQQGTVQLTSDYDVSGMSHLRARIGGTQRHEDADNGDSGKLSGFTGSLAYTRTLSAKTRVETEIFRRVESYVAGASALISTGGSLGLGWTPTPKTAVGARYEFIHSAFKGDGSEDSGRSDDYGTATLDLSYQALHWLTLRPFASYRDRNSNVDTESFDDMMLGAELLLRFE